MGGGGAMPVGDFGGLPRAIRWQQQQHQHCMNSRLFGLHFCEERPHGSSPKEEINSYSSRDAHEKVESTTQRDVNSPFSLKRTAKLVADSVMACVTV